MSELNLRPAASEEVAGVLTALKDGELVILPLENGYVLAADAFNASAIARINGLRGARPGTSLQVIVASSAMAKGVCFDFDEQCQALADAFWPGNLTLQLAPQQGLNWDLGDGGALGEFALRVPAQEFTQEVLNSSGPLAIAIAAPLGQAVPTAYVAGGSLMVLAGQVAVAIDAGQLMQSGPSTVVRRNLIGHLGGLEVIREGSITIAELRQILPGIELAIA